MVKERCCNRKFPTFPIIALVLGVLWLLNDLGIISKEVPWFPIALIILAVGWLIGFYKKK